MFSTSQRASRGVGEYRSLWARFSDALSRTSPTRLLVGGCVSLVLLGSALLSLPVAVTAPPRLSFLEALFEATSAVCVTGLSVIDVSKRLSTFGQLVILALVQTGGLGVMTISTLFAVLLGRRISLRGRLLIQEEMHQDYLAGLVRLVRMVAGVTLLVEGLGAFALFLAWLPDLEPAKAAYFGIFHAVSAFNNAGFDLWGTSLVRFAGRPEVVLPVAALLMVGGIGFSTIADLSSWRPKHRLQLYTRIALKMAIGLWGIAWVVIALVEWTNASTLGTLPWGSRILAAFFTAVTPRTAGYNVVDTGALRPATLLFIIVLMFIGVSPGSTGGGVKVTTAATVGATVLAALRGQHDLVIEDRRLPKDMAFRAITLVTLAGLWVLAMSGFILLIEPLPPLSVLFEVTSAFGTVGLSTGITAALSELSRLAIIVTMLIGKVGPVTLAIALARRSADASTSWRYPEERISLG